MSVWVLKMQETGLRFIDLAYRFTLSSLSEKTRISNHLQMSLQRQHILLSYFKTLKCWYGLGLEPETSRTVVRRSTN